MTLTRLLVSPFDQGFLLHTTREESILVLGKVTWTIRKKLPASFAPANTLVVADICVYKTKCNKVTKL